MRFMPPPENLFTFLMPRADKFWLEYVNEITKIVSQRVASDQGLTRVTNFLGCSVSSLKPLFVDRDVLRDTIMHGFTRFWKTN
jgi:hypothetical protein